MREILYSIEDREYSFLIQRIGDVFRRLEVDYALVGGAAVQVRVAAMIGKGEGKPLEDLILTEQISERKNLRRTHDIDLVTKDPEKPLEVIEALEGEVSTDNDIFITKLTRRGIKRPFCRVTNLNGEAVITLNVSYTERDLKKLKLENYNHFLEQAENVEFDYEELHPKIRVIRPEHIIASKLSRNIPRDQFDILTLVDTALTYGKPLDLDEIGRCLGVINHQEIDGESKNIIEVPVEYLDRFELFKAEFEQRKASSNTK